MFLAAHVSISLNFAIILSVSFVTGRRGVSFTAEFSESYITNFQNALSEVWSIPTILAHVSMLNLSFFYKASYITWNMRL